MTDNIDLKGIYKSLGEFENCLSVPVEPFVNVKNPLGIHDVSRVYGGGDGGTKIKSTGTKRVFSTGSQRDSANGKPRMELLPDDLLSRVAIWYGLGAEKYGDNNWRLGQPQAACLGSLKRHLTKWENGDTDEDHLSAIIFNALSIMNVEMYHSDNAELVFVKYKDQIKNSR